MALKINGKLKISYEENLKYNKYNDKALLNKINNIKSNNWQIYAIEENLLPIYYQQNIFCFLCPKYEKYKNIPINEIINDLCIVLSELLIHGLCCHDEINYDHGNVSGILNISTTKGIIIHSVINENDTDFNNEYYNIDLTQICNIYNKLTFLLELSNQEQYGTWLTLIERKDVKYWQFSELQYSDNVSADVEEKDEEEGEEDNQINFVTCSQKSAYGNLRIKLLELINIITLARSLNINVHGNLLFSDKNYNGIILIPRRANYVKVKKYNQQCKLFEERIDLKKS